VLCANGLRARRGLEGKREAPPQRCEAMDKNRITRRQSAGRAGNVIAKSISINGAKRDPAVCTEGD